MPYGDYSILYTSKVLVAFRVAVKHCPSELSRCALIVAVSTCLEPVDTSILIQSRRETTGFSTQIFDKAGVSIRFCYVVNSSRCSLVRGSCWSAGGGSKKRPNTTGNPAILGKKSSNGPELPKGSGVSIRSLVTPFVRASRDGFRGCHPDSTPRDR